MILVSYLRWHYVDVLKELIAAWGNFLWLGAHYFSVPILLRTFFSYWKQFYRPYRSRGFDPKEMLKVFGENIFSRIMGAVIRLVILIVAFAAEIFIVVAGVALTIGWIVLPFFIGWGLAYPFL